MSSVSLPPSITRIAREKPFLLTFGIAGTLTGLWWIVRDYTRWKALGRGGISFSPFGWLTAFVLTPIAVSQHRITETSNLDSLVQRIAQAEGEEAVFRSLTLLQRRGDRPQVRGVIPQRQVDSWGSQTFSTDLNAHLVSLASDYPTLLRIAPSIWEGGHANALFLRRPPADSSSSTSLAARTLLSAVPHLELAHVHPTDGSLHVPLSPADAAEMIRKGWGVRHRLGGRICNVPSTYVFVYAPRDSDEVAVVKKIIAASVEYTTGLSKVMP